MAAPSTSLVRSLPEHGTLRRGTSSALVAARPGRLDCGAASIGVLDCGAASIELID
jgi:hypothetical protein